MYAFDFGNTGHMLSETKLDSACIAKKAQPEYFALSRLQYNSNTPYDSLVQPDPFPNCYALESPHRPSYRKLRIKDIPLRLLYVHLHTG